MFLKRSRGSITVFICIVMSVLIPLCCILTDIARYSMAEKQAENALKLTVESVLAAYDRQLKEQYGLFALYPRDKEAIENEIYELLSRNLNIGAAADGVSDLYDFKIRNIEVITFYNLTEPQVLKQQIAEFMKYRAPIQAVQEFYEKLKIMKGLMKEADMVEKKIEVEKLMNDIRSSLVNLYFMLEEQLIKFNDDPVTPQKTIKDLMFDKVDSYWESGCKNIENANKEVEPIKEAQDGYISIYPDYERAKNEKESAERRLESIESRISKKEDEISKLESELAEATDENRVNSLQSRISSIEEDIEELEEEYSEAYDEYSKAYDKFSSLEEEISKYKNVLDQKLPQVINNLNQAITNNKYMVSSLQYLLNHLSTHKEYHKELISIIDQLGPKLTELDKKSSEILKEAKDNDGIVADKVGGELDKQLQLVQKETFDEIRSKLSSNLDWLDKWIGDVSGCIEILEECRTNLEKAMEQAEKVHREPQKGTRFEGYENYTSVTSAIETMKTNTSSLKALKDMEEWVYSIPSFKLSPKANSNEYNAFKIWFNQKFSNIYEVDEPAKENDKKLKQLKESIKAFTEDAVNIKEDNEESESKNLNDIEDEIRENLPSRNGSESSDSAIEDIKRLIGQSQANRPVNESFYNGQNPLDGAIEGVGQVDEKGKNFFSFQFERIKSFFNSIGNILANGLESMAESLYMNEYIVSAFKCATSFDNKIEHDIGWNRPLDKTYFNRGEVEYIIFGKDDEASNINLSRLSVFAIRLPFNLMHVYTDPDKNAAALSLATTIAGWTIFGVPVVHNFLLISWAGLESYVDTEILLNNGRVPLIKTSLSWILGIESLYKKLKDILVNDVKEYAQEKFDSAVNNVFSTVEETVTSIVDTQIDKLFAPLEAKILEVAENITAATGSSTGNTDDSVSLNISVEFLASLDFSSLESLKQSLESRLSQYVNSTIEELKTYGQEKLEQYKSSLKAKVKSAIFGSSHFKELKEKISKEGSNLINKGINAAADSIDGLLGNAEGSLSNNIKGKLIMMDYVDYLRLMLLAVPDKTKTARIADLMQLNIQSITGNKDISVSQYKTYIFVRAEIDFNTWFLPEKLFRKDSGMILVEWSQGY